MLKQLNKQGAECSTAVASYSELPILSASSSLPSITQSYLSTAQASSSFKWLNTHTSTSTTPTFITEALIT